MCFRFPCSRSLTVVSNREVARVGGQARLSIFGLWQKNVPSASTRFCLPRSREGLKMRRFVPLLGTFYFFLILIPLIQEF